MSNMLNLCLKYMYGEHIYVYVICLHIPQKQIVQKNNLASVYQSLHQRVSACNVNDICVKYPVRVIVYASV